MNINLEPIVSTKPLYITVLSLTALSLVACTSKAQANDDPKESKVAVSEASPQAVETYTIEEIRAEQEIIEGQIERIKAKGELERAEKIVLLRLIRRKNILLDAKLEIQEEIIKSQKQRLVEEFASVRGRAQK